MKEPKAVPAARRRLKRAHAERLRQHKAIVAREKKLDAVKKRFSAAHRAGNKDLAEGDYAGVERVIRQEADAIKEFSEMTKNVLRRT
jgi:hypothetical protein